MLLEHGQAQPTLELKVTYVGRQCCVTRSNGGRQVTGAMVSHMSKFDGPATVWHLEPEERRAFMNRVPCSPQVALMMSCRIIGPAAARATVLTAADGILHAGASTHSSPAEAV